MHITQAEVDLLSDILSTNWLYDKLCDSDGFGNKMDEIDALIEKLDRRSS